MREAVEAKVSEIFAEADTLFVSPIGSRLYGLENKNSDYDYVAIKDSTDRISFQKVSDVVDIKIMDVMELIEQYRKGINVNQLDIVYSRMKQVKPEWMQKWQPFFNGLRPDMRILRENLHRNARNNMRSDLFKRVRLGVYLASRWNYIYNYGVENYNPNLSANEKVAINMIAKNIFSKESVDERLAIINHMFTLGKDDAKELFKFE